MPRTYCAETGPSIGVADDIVGRYRGLRASHATAATIVHATILRELGKREEVTLALSDLVAYSDLAGATVTVRSGTDIIWVVRVGAGNTHIPLITCVTADRGKDLSATITGFTAQSHVSITARLV